MAWTTPVTAVTNSPLTAAQYNASIVSNFAETAVAKATTAGRYFVNAGSGSIREAEMHYVSNNSDRTVTSSSYVNVASNGTKLQPIISGTASQGFVVYLSGQVLGGDTLMLGYTVSGDISQAAADANAIRLQGGYTSQDATVYSQLVNRVSGTGDFTIKPAIKSDGSDNVMLCIAMTILEF
jgi:hypothetical protein